MKEYPAFEAHRLSTGPWRYWPSLLLGCALLLCASRGAAATPVTFDSPVAFFTNVANRLLQSELDLSLNRIQIYPTNQYTPAVHRLLQFTANLYDASTNRTFTNSALAYPTIFRPVFGTDPNTNVFIVGYEEIATLDDLISLPGTLRALSSPAVAASVGPNDRILGVPFVIGARKGLPNFNEIAMQSVSLMTRRMTIYRPSVISAKNTWTTNISYILGISNVVGIEAWNSYSNSYTRPLDLYVTDYLTMAMSTNVTGFDASAPRLDAVLGGTLSLPILTTNFWAGYTDYSSTTPSLKVPLLTNLVFLPNSVGVYNPGDQSWTFRSNQLRFSATNLFPVPEWEFHTTNRLQFVMVDHDTRRILDFVLLDGLNATRNLSEETRDANGVTGYNGLWSTNRLGTDGITCPTLGMQNQVLVSLGCYGTDTAVWYGYGQVPASGHAPASTLDWEMDNFRAFFGLGPTHGYSIDNTNLIQQVPLSPSKRFSQSLSWQVNDPLVHYTAADLCSDLINRDASKLSLVAPIPTLPNIGAINNRYSPWGGGPSTPYNALSYDLRFKDPGVWTSDFWNFPAGEPLSFAMLGRVHRGTPWQTVYLKSSSNSLNFSTWIAWTGNPQPQSPNAACPDALFTLPTRDWRLVTELSWLLYTNSPADLLSVNNPDSNAWLTALNGIVALTNSEIPSLIGTMPHFSQVLMVSNSPQANLIADRIAQSRAARPGGTFADVGEILATAALSESTPWLDLSTETRRWFISDEAYETIPAQLLGKLRPDSIGSFAQTGSTVHVRFTGLDGYAYAVRVSDDLINWKTVTTLSPTFGVFEFVESLPTGAPRRFYRSALLP
jgi:hypothetical protein